MPDMIRDLIEIPEQVHKGDFVLRLTEGVAHPKETLRDYVVTPQLVSCFDNALGFIRSAVEQGSSKAAYLHGSFGSGKSHFMAVLHLLMQQNADARSIPALAPVIAKHAGWSDKRKFLLVPYHMIGARSMESAIFGQYVDYVRRLHPDAPMPGVYLAERIFADAQHQRKLLGDTAFFDALNAGKQSGGWGKLAAKWDAASFENALAAEPRSEARARLVGDLIENFFTAYRDVTGATGEDFLPLDDGLSILSKHAKSLGYDGLILFLDELILWLASRVADMGFVTREGQKLAKLVESTTPDRPIPIISFVARQRDLRELVGDHFPGAEKLAFGDTLKWWEGRFHTITLEDRNLPAIAEKRVLRPKSDAARAQLDRAFEETKRVREDILSTLLTSQADQQMFRAVYPFSPALVQTLVAVSSALQRERTALKVMLQLLVNQRDTLELGSLVPVGDLFEVIAEGDEPFSEEMRVHFENAKRLYFEKLLPMLERDHGIRDEDARALASDDPKARAFRANDRLIKTLLLAALVPEVEALKGLTAPRLAALNHGTIRSPIPGQEGSMVLERCRRWAAQVGEIRIGEGANPTIQLQITGVDTEGILEAAKVNDNVGNRRMKVREMLYRDLGVRDGDSLFVKHEFSWRGTARSADIIFGSVSDLPDDSLRSTGTEWRVVIDFPFDTENRSPADDLARLESFRATGENSRTLCWIPAFFSREAQAELGKLVVLDHILTGERFTDYAKHLSTVDRVSARSLLESQRNQLRERIKLCLEAAYGIGRPIPGSIDDSLELADRFQSLDAGFRPQPPVGANLGAAFEHLLNQMLSHQYPAHPRFEVDVKTSMLRKVLDEARRATQEPNGRIVVEKELRPILRQIANPLQLGEMHEEAFLLGQHWRDHFLKKEAAAGGTLTVAKIRPWFDEPAPMGLPRDLQNLVILVFADQTARSFYLHGAADQPPLEKLEDAHELREQKLPPQNEWAEAVRRVGAILGVAGSPLLNASNLVKLATDAKALASAHRENCAALCNALGTRLDAVGVNRSDAARLATAQAALAFVEAVNASNGAALIAAIAAAKIETSAEAMGTSLKKAADVVGVLTQTQWPLFEALADVHGDRAADAARILARVREALSKDELALGLNSVLLAAVADAAKLLAGKPSPPPLPSPPPTGFVVVEEAKHEALDLKAATQALGEIQEKLRQGSGRRLNIAWRIEEPKSSK